METLPVVVVRAGNRDPEPGASLDGDETLILGKSYISCSNTVILGPHLANFSGLDMNKPDDRQKLMHEIGPFRLDVTFEDGFGGGPYLMKSIIMDKEKKL